MLQFKEKGEEKGGVESEVMEGVGKKEENSRKGGRGRCKRGDVGRRKKKRGMMRTRKRVGSLRSYYGDAEDNVD